MSETTKVEILQIQTEQSEKSVKSLKSRIKELKDEIGMLDEGTEEYNRKIQQTAELSRQLNDINEAIKGSAKDFGEVVSNVAGTLGGLSGTVQGVVSAMSLIGVESKSAEKAIKTLVALQGLTSAFAAIDSGAKAFGRLRVQIQASTVAMNGMKKALIGTGIGALVVALGTLISNWETVAKWLGINNDRSKELAKTTDKLTEAHKNFNKSLDFQVRLLKAKGVAEKDILEYQRKQLQAEVERQRFEYKRLEWEKKRLVAQGKRKQAEKDYNEALKAQAENLKEAKQALVDFDKEMKISQAQQETDARKLKEQNASAAYTKALANARKLVDDQYNYIRNKYSQIREEIERQADETTFKIELDFGLSDSERSGQLATNEINRMTALIESYKNEIAEIAQTTENRRKALENQLKEQVAKGDLTKALMQQQLTEFDANENKIISDLANAQKTLLYTIEKTVQAQERESEQFRLQKEQTNNYIDNLRQSTDIELEYMQRKTELKQDEYSLDAEMNAVELDHTRDLLELEQERLSNEISILTQKNKLKLIAEDEYQTQMADLQSQQLLNAQNLADAEVEIERNKLESKKELNQRYIKAYTTIAGNIGDVLGSLADMNDANFERQKQFEVAQAIISTIASGVSAVNAIWSDKTIPTVAARVAMTATTVASLLASGFAQVEQIRKTQPNSSTPNVSQSSVSVLSPVYSNVRQTTTSDDFIRLNENAQNQKVFVVYQDIEDAGRKVEVIRGQNVF